jgi:glycosyltransferase involved in cell wall biosynthesis
VKRFICVQMGARRGYAVPAILERAGLLDRFYTDICGDVGIGRAATRLSGLPFVGAPFGRLAGRKLPGSIRDKTYAFGASVMRHALRSTVVGPDPASIFRERLRFGDDLGRAMISAGYSSATHVYSMFGEGGPFVEEARRRGLSVVSEVYLSLSADHVLRVERKEYADWEPDEPDYELLRRELGVPNVLLECTDVFVCPSEIVRDDLVANWGIAENATVVVPYGIDPAWLTLEPDPSRGRVLFAGSADLRKGIHYLAMAAAKLSSRRGRYEFRVAGDVTARVRSQPLCRHLTFLGRIPRSHIQAEFRRADVLVLPSLAEGSAGVTYEALAAGLPVITTKAAGSIVRDGLEGRVVQERDPDALAEAIEDVIESRIERDRMAAAGRARAHEYTWETYSGRMVEALQGIA